MIDDFYRIFEDRFRGSREQIKERQRSYLPFVLPLLGVFKRCRALDLGCGRGEWLEILHENGIQAEGVDLDEGMLQVCKDLKLPARNAEALATLQELPDNSLALVSGFHIVEHLPFEAVVQLITEAYRVLKPAGILLLETPNAENIIVGTHNFYVDPTHQKPIPHVLLEFVTEYSGFVRNKLLRLQEDPQLAAGQIPGLWEVLAGASPDYGIVAQKPGPQNIIELWDPVFAEEYGIGLETLATRYDVDLGNRFGEIVERHSGLEQQFGDLRNQVAASLEQSGKIDSELVSVKQKLERNEGITSTLQEWLKSVQGQLSESISLRTELLTLLQTQLKESNQRILDAEHELRTTLELRIAQLEANLNEARSNQHYFEQRLLNSTSWRITAPARAAYRGVRNGAKAVIRPFVLGPMKLATNTPRTRKWFATVVRRYPALDDRLRRLAINRGMLPAADGVEGTKGEVTNPILASDEEIVSMTPQAERIYRQLKSKRERSGR